MEIEYLVFLLGCLIVGIFLIIKTQSFKAKISDIFTFSGNKHKSNNTTTIKRVRNKSKVKVKVIDNHNTNVDDITDNSTIEIN